MASAAYERRNAAARSKGYKDYYDYRAHDSGRIPPSQPPLSGEPLARARGHRGAADFESLARSGRIELVSAHPTQQDAAGRFTVVTILVELDDGTTREFTLRKKDLNPRTLNQLYSDLQSSGGTIIDRYNIFGWYEVDDYDYEYDEAA